MQHVHPITCNRPTLTSAQPNCPTQLQPNPTPPQEVHAALCSLEGEAERLAAPERALLDSDAVARDQLYARAEAVSSALVSLGEGLQSTVGAVTCVCVCMCVRERVGMCVCGHSLRP